MTLVPELARVRAHPGVRFVHLADPPRRDVRTVVLGPRPATGVRTVLDALARAAREGTDAAASSSR